MPQPPATVEFEGLRADERCAAYHHRVLEGATGNLLRVLYSLVARRGALVTRDELIVDVWERAFAGADDRIYAAMSALRDVLAPTHLTILGVRGAGWKLVWKHGLELPESRRHRILVVDDDPHIVRAVVLVLHDVEVDVASGLREAFEIFRRGRYGAILLDVALGDGNGLTFGKFVRTRDHDVRIMLLTDDDDPRVVRQAGRSFEATYHPKPMDREWLRKFCVEACGGAKLVPAIRDGSSPLSRSRQPETRRGLLRRARAVAFSFRCVHFFLPSF